jgi:hypothetical protein
MRTLSVYETETSNAVPLIISLEVFEWRRVNGVIGLMLFPGINELSSSVTAMPPPSLRLYTYAAIQFGIQWIANHRDHWIGNNCASTIGYAGSWIGSAQSVATSMVHETNT